MHPHSEVLQAGQGAAVCGHLWTDTEDTTAESLLDTDLGALTPKKLPYKIHMAYPQAHTYKLAALWAHEAVPTFPRDLRDQLFCVILCSGHVTCFSQQPSAAEVLL